MDGNQFFSSIAQSAAAIVAIFAAFIITKVITNQSEFNKKTNLLDDLIVGCRSLKDEASTRKFEWYNNQILKNQFEVIDGEYSHNGVIHTPEEYYGKYNFSIFQDKNEILKMLREKCAELAKRKQHDAYLTQFYSFGRELIEEEDLILKLIVRINQQIRHVSNFITENKDNPESSILINISLILALFLFLVGVMYPLSFLPVNFNSEINLSFSAFWSNLFSTKVKGIILFLASFIFISLLICFWIVNLGLKFDEAKMKDLQKYSELAEYSIFLKNMEKNKGNIGGDIPSWMGVNKE
jgi:hypothetical protein